MSRFSGIPKNGKLLRIARILRRQMTKQEKHLWYDFLQLYPIKIYKQRIIGNYIVDFYCSSAKIVIELDGSQHRRGEGLESDQTRDAYMESLGLKVLRFSNQDVEQNFYAVCERIDMVIRDRIGL